MDDVMDTKTLLKLARQYIDDNNLKEAQQCCKKVLRKNNNNYMALVLLGKSYGKTDDAPISYERAIELKPDRVVAWQGLAYYYEGKEDESAKTKLLGIYDKILMLNIEVDYANKTIKKYGELSCQLKDKNSISAFIQYIRVQNNDILIKTAKAQVLQLLKLGITCKDEDIPDVINILKNLTKDDLSEDEGELILHGKLILQSKDFMCAIEEIIALEVFSTSLILRQWVCKQLIAAFAQEYSFRGFDIDAHINKLTVGIEETIHGGFLLAVMLFRRTRFESAYRKCFSVIKDQLHKADESEALFIVNCSKMTPNRLRTKNLCNYFLRKDNLTKQNFIMQMNSVLLFCYIQEKDFTKSLYHLLKIPIKLIDPIVLTHFGKLYSEMRIVDNVVWSILQPTDYFELFMAFDYLKKKQYNKAIDVLALYNKHPLKYYYIGLSYWYMDLYDECLENFKIAAELVPNHPKIYYCLGIQYYRYKDQIENSKICLEKAYSMCKTDINVVKVLCVIYSKLGLHELEFKLLKSAFSIPQTRAFWVCDKLARIYHSQDMVDTALMYLKAGIKVQPNDPESHEKVADIYLSKKNIEQAIVSYYNVVHLSERLKDQGQRYFRCLTKIGFIHLDEARYDKSVEVFEKVLDNDIGNVLAMKGLTECRIVIGLECMNTDSYREARENLQLALNRIIPGFSLAIQHWTYHQFYGDILLFMTRLPDEYSYADVYKSNILTRKDRIDMYKMAIDNYGSVIDYRNSIILFRSALTYFEYYCETKDINLCKISYNLAVLFMKVHSNVWIVWDFLGKLSYHLNKRDTAYFCFSKALILRENSNNEMYDLGLLYLKLNKSKIASYEYVIEPIDLSSFAPRLVEKELSEESSNGIENSEICGVDPVILEAINKHEYKKWIRIFNPTLLQTDEPTFDSATELFKTVPGGNHIIEWYLHILEEIAWDYLYFGNSMEKKGLLITALRYYNLAYEAATKKHKNEMLSYKARVLLKMQKYEKAVKVYNTIRSLNRRDTCGLAFGHYKLNNLKMSYALYDEALRDLCEDDGHRVRILIPLSYVAYQLKHSPCDATMLLLEALKLICKAAGTFSIRFLKSHVQKKVNSHLLAHVLTENLHKQMDKTIWWCYTGLNYFRVMKFFVPNRRRAVQLATRSLRLYPDLPELWAVYILCMYMERIHKPTFLCVLINTVRRRVKVSEHLNIWLSKME